jgi:hypothetical protein
LVLHDDLRFVPTVGVVSELEEDQPEHRCGVLAGFQIGIGAKVVRCTPKVVFELLELVFGHR